MSYMRRDGKPWINVRGVSNSNFDNYMFESLRLFWKTEFGQVDEMRIEIVNSLDWAPLTVVFTDLKKNERFTFELISEISVSGLEGFYVSSVPTERWVKVTESTPDDLRVTVCNYAVAINSVPQSAKAYVLLHNPGGGGDRLYILVKSRSGRWIEKWEDRRRLTNFREKTVPPQHPLYERLKQ